MSKLRPSAGHGSLAGRCRRSVGLAFILSIVTVFLVNARSLFEGGCYLVQMATWDARAVRPVAVDGPFGLCHELVHLSNAGRAEAIVSSLHEFGLQALSIAITDCPQPDLWVPLGGGGPSTLLVAHYDKSREDATYQGAADNTAAVCVLLALAHRLSVNPPGRPVGLLFTAGEERGLLGARVALQWLGEGAPIESVINLDMLGRGRLAVRASGEAGLHIWLPFLGDLVYDGARLSLGELCRQPDRALVLRLRRAIGDGLAVYRRVAAQSDASVFQQAGIPTVCLSSDDLYYLATVWERDSDRVELLDERHLELALYALEAFVRD